MPGDSAVSQEVRKSIRDYFSGPITYSPIDPETRSKVFQAHTGHSGLFYNCDGEECKRNSPYICWKTNSESQFPPRRGWWRGAKLDLAEVRQRISDGAGEGCRPNCQCRDCMAAQQVSDNYLADQPKSSAQQPAEFATNYDPAIPTEAPSTDRKRFGLMTGANATSTTMPKSIANSAPTRSKPRYEIYTAKTIDSNPIRR